MTNTKLPIFKDENEFDKLIIWTLLTPWRWFWKAIAYFALLVGEGPTKAKLVWETK